MRRLLCFSIGVAVAATIGLYFLQGQWYFLASGIAAAMLAVGIWLGLRKPQLQFLPMILLGCVLGLIWMSMFETYYLSVPRAADEKHITLTITATDYSRETTYGIAVDGFAEINGKIYKISVFLPENAAIKPGDTLTGRYTLRATLPGCSGEYAYSYSRGVFLSAKINRMPVIEEAKKLHWYSYPAVMRQNITESILAIFPEDMAGFAIALLIGDTDRIDFETDYSFKISGISHIVAVSGFHVTVLFALVHTLLGKNRWLSALIGLPVLFFFAAVVGFSPSITRACLMHGLMIIAVLFDKEYDPLSALAFAVVVMLAINPWSVTNVSFQLSVFCMVGILLFSERIKQWILSRKVFSKVKGKRKKLVASFAASVAMSIGATILVTPLCAHYFGMASLAGVITNLLTLWMVSFTFYGIIFACIIGIFYQPLGCIIAKIVSIAIQYILAIAKMIAKIPLAAVYTESIYIVFWLIFVYILLAIYLLAKRKRLVLIICCSVIGLCFALIASWTQPYMDECRVTVLDVGQGQCILLQSDGKTYVVDCGGDSDKQTAMIAVNALKSQGINSIDGMIFTHFDKDHAAGAAYLLTQIEAKMIYYPDCADEEGMMQRIASAHEGESLIIGYLTNISYGNTKITLIPSKTDLSDNEAGLSILFQTENCDILITGDRSASGERELMHQIQLPELEVLIVGHHGSKYSTCNMLLEQTSPEIAIVSVGADNPYGHPASETLERLLDAECVIYRTDLHGTVTYRG